MNLAESIVFEIVDELTDIVELQKVWYDLPESRQNEIRDNLITKVKESLGEYL